MPNHTDCIHSVPLLDDVGLEDGRADGVVVVVDVEEEEDVARHLHKVEHDGDNRNAHNDNFFPTNDVVICLR